MSDGIAPSSCSHSHCLNFYFSTHIIPAQLQVFTCLLAAQATRANVLRPLLEFLRNFQEEERVKIPNPPLKDKYGLIRSLCQGDITETKPKPLTAARVQGGKLGPLIFKLFLASESIS